MSTPVNEQSNSPKADRGPLTNPGSMAVGSQVENVTAHRVDSKDLISGADTRGQAADVQTSGQPQADTI